MKYLKQLAFICLICIAGQLISNLIGGFVPSNVVAMLLLLLLLGLKIVKLERVQETADFFLANMAIFFIPATVSVFFQYEVFAGNVLKLILVCIITTIVTSLSAALTVKYVIKLMQIIKRKQKGRQ